MDVSGQFRTAMLSGSFAVWISQSCSDAHGLWPVCASWPHKHSGEPSCGVCHPSSLAFRDASALKHVPIVPSWLVPRHVQSARASWVHPSGWLSASIRRCPSKICSSHPSSPMSRSVCRMLSRFRFGSPVSRRKALTSSGLIGTVYSTLIFIAVRGKEVPLSMAVFHQSNFLSRPSLPVSIAHRGRGADRTRRQTRTTGNGPGRNQRFLPPLVRCQ